MGRDRCSITLQTQLAISVSLPIHVKSSSGFASYSVLYLSVSLPINAESSGGLNSYSVLYLTDCWEQEDFTFPGCQGGVSSDILHAGIPWEGCWVQPPLTGGSRSTDYGATMQSQDMANVAEYR